MSDIGKLLEKFKKVDTSDFPDFYIYTRIMDKGLWVLWVAKEKLGEGKLAAAEISSIIRDVKEVSIHPIAIAQSFRKAGQKIHIHHVTGLAFYEIMKAGKDHLRTVAREAATAGAVAGKDEVQVFYFEPGKTYTPKRLLAKDILAGLTGELRIVDPYCSERTLDCFKDVKARAIKLLTRVENLHQRARERFLRELQDFKSENPDMEFRDYPNTDLHDRYIISPSSLVILGHSMKDLGAKESFAIVLNEKISRNLIEALSESFDRRWKQSTPLLGS
jgi:hypothetical protein